MPLADLMPYLPLVGAVLGAVVGGFVGAYANGRTRNKEEQKARDQELKGLTILLFDEIGGNDVLLQILTKDPDLIGLSSWTNLQMAVWNDAKVRLAQLMNKDHIMALVAYYGQIQRILESLSDDVLPPEEKHKAVLFHAPSAQKYGKAALMRCAKYLFLDDPEYTDEAHQKFVREAKRLMEE